MNDQLPDYSSIGLPPEDISVDGTLGLQNTANVQSTDSPDFSPLSIPDGYAPLDNRNGTSVNNNNGDPTPAIHSMFSTNNLFGSALDFLTGGATGLADQLAGAYTPVPANQVAQTDYTPLIIGAGALILLFVVLK